MPENSGPVIVRYRESQTAVPLPGVHSHNAGRRALKRSRAAHPGQLFRFLLLIIGICAIGYYGYSLANERIYQTYENWVFDQQIARPPSAATASRPANGAVLGRVKIARLHLGAIVREGVDAKILSIAVGHVPSTSLAGQPGNFVIAAHRDTLFRALKDVRRDDVIALETPGKTYTYQVVGTRIVKPSDVSVLRPDGGGLFLFAKTAPPPELLTMITCYPFYYVGSAPKRFIVEAKLVSASESSQLARNGVKGDS
jgi:sortase A